MGLRILLSLSGLLLFQAEASPERTCPESYASFSPSYQTTSIKARYQGEDSRGVVYLSPKAAARYQVRFESGKILDFRSAPLDGEYIFVMNENGSILVTNHNQGGVFHHSSLVGGKAVASAGTMRIKDGKLLKITSSSGHYRPTKKYFEQVLAELRSHGISTEGVRIVAYDAVAKKYLLWGVGTGAAALGQAVLWKADKAVPESSP